MSFLKHVSPRATSASSASVGESLVPRPAPGFLRPPNCRSLKSLTSSSVWSRVSLGPSGPRSPPGPARAGPRPCRRPPPTHEAEAGGVPLAPPHLGALQLRGRDASASRSVSTSDLARAPEVTRGGGGHAAVGPVAQRGHALVQAVAQVAQAGPGRQGKG